MTMSIETPRIAIIGRTNVGKSTLFNRLIEEHKSLVSEKSGTTRDRHEGFALWQGHVITLIDTGGIDHNPEGVIDEKIQEQAHAAIKDADAILFIVDLKAGLLPEDRALAKMIHQIDKPIIVAGNKADTNEIGSRTLSDWTNWELERPRPISAARGTGTGDLLDHLFETLRGLGKEPVPVREMSPIRVAVIGRPNVGKSSLLNSIIGEHRFITHDADHTTRGPNDTLLSIDGQEYLFIDTAGIRKLARVHAGKSKLENSGVNQTLRVMKRADVVLFLVDINQSIQLQDKHLAGLVEASEASAIIVANKWDLVPEKDPVTINKYEEYLRYMLPMLSYAPIVFTSAATGKRVQALLDVINRVWDNQFTSLHDKTLKEFLSHAVKKHKPSRGKGVAHPRIKSFTQSGVKPPRFDLAIRQNRKDVLAQSYLRFLANQLRERFAFEGVPIRIRVRAKKKSHTT